MPIMVRTVAVALACCGLLCLTAGAGALVAHPGAVSVVDVTLTNPPADLDALSQAGFSIGKVDGNVATVYATSGELSWLKTHGYRFTVQGLQPSAPAAKEGAKALGQYHSYADLTSALQAYAAAYGASQSTNPDICRLYTLGQSVQGRELWAMLITDNPDSEEFEPEFKYVSTMHGDEPVGTELCLYFIDMLLTQYGVDNRITQDVDNTAIWIVPLMNPDGLTLGTRFNAAGYDLNRTFPSYPTDFTGTVFDGVALGDAGRPPEVQHVMRWTADNSFTLSANYHTGALLMNYPYDDDGKGSGHDAPTPDDTLFEDIAVRYSFHNTPMYTSSVPLFSQGITNGSAWSEVDGGMMDWNYRYAGCNEITIELSSTKTPAQNTLPTLWNDNRESMLAYLEAADIGVRGIVQDRTSQAPLYAKIEVAGNAQAVFTDPDVGDYHRMLLPGTYTLSYSAPGYRTKQVADIVVTDGRAVLVNVDLEPFAVITDINGDNAIDVSDVQLVVLAILGYSIAYDADANGDGNVNSVDLQLVVDAVQRS